MKVTESMFVTAIATVIVELIFISGVFGQNSGHGSDSRSGRLRKDVPAVYLTVERVGTVQDSSQIAAKRIWLRLRNNTRWRIRIEASGGNDLIEDARLYYVTLDGRENIVDSRPCHVCSNLMIQSGKNILFTIPYAASEKASSLRINFSYEWESDLDVASGREARHYVYFHFKDLKNNE